MPSTAFNKFHSFVEALAEKTHNLGSDTLTLFLTDTAPVATNTVLANITQISYTNLSPRVVSVATSAQTNGTYQLRVSPLTLTATGGAVQPFRYVGLYNDTATNDELIGWYDHGELVSMVDGDVFLVDFSESVSLLEIT
jgi:hypothetical protein